MHNTSQPLYYLLVRTLLITVTVKPYILFIDVILSLLTCLFTLLQVDCDGIAVVIHCAVGLRSLELT